MKNIILVLAIMAGIGGMPATNAANKAFPSRTTDEELVDKKSGEESVGRISGEESVGRISGEELLGRISDGEFKSHSLGEMEYLPDGERYARQEGNDVIAYSVKTGAKTDTLFCYAEAKGSKPATIDGYVLGPSERYLLVYGNKEQIYRHSFRADYYIYDRKRKEIRVLSDTMPVMQPTFSPDGKYIAFVRENNLYIHKLDFKTEVAVTRDGSVGGVLNGVPDWLYEEEFGCTCLFAFSPDSKQLAFVRLDETKVPKFEWMNYLTSEVKSLKYPRAGETNAEASVVVYDTYYKTLKTMVLPEQSDSYIPRIRWTNEVPATTGRAGETESKLAIFRLNRDQNKLEMFLANPKSTVSTRTYQEESKQYFIDYSQVDEWQFLSDNSFICVNETDGFRHVYLYSATGIKQKQLTKGCYDVTKVYGYDEKTQTLYFQAAGQLSSSVTGRAVCDPLNRYVYALNTKKGSVRCYSTEAGMHDATFTPTYEYFVDAYQSVQHPTVYTLYNNAGKPLRVLEDNHEVATLAKEAGLPVKEFFSFVTPNGDTLNGWMLVPKEVREGARGSNQKPQAVRLPVLMFHYSGPASQQVLNRWRISWEEYLALEEGVICVCVDPRGTDGRGRAFRNATYMNIGTKEAEDQVYAARYMQTLPYVDADKIGIWGWSYGGYATIRSMSVCGMNPSLGKSPFLFGMAVAPVTDWRFYDSAYTERYMRRPQVNEDGYHAASAVEHADALQGDLLIIHGLADDNVHPRNTLVYTEELVKLGRQFDMQVYPDDNHFLRRGNNQRHVYERLLRFVRQHIREDKR